MLEVALDGPVAPPDIFSARMLLIFIIFWIVVGLAVFFLAMRRGSRDEDGSPEGSRLSRGAITLGIIVAFAFGLIVPAIVLAVNGDDKASEAPGGVHLTADETEGRELFAHTCNVCHTLAAVKSVGRIGPDLDVRVGDDIPTQAGRIALVENAIAEGRARGLGNMPAKLYTGKEAENVAKFVAAVAGH
jgi:mono/diheme cytochrome c family protein